MFLGMVLGENESGGGSLVVMSIEGSRAGGKLVELESLLMSNRQNRTRYRFPRQMVWNELALPPILP